MSKLLSRFEDWVDSFGRGAWDRMKAGMTIAGMAAGIVCLCVAVVLESPVLFAVGFVAFIVHLIYVMGAL